MNRSWIFLLFFASFLFSSPPVNSYVFDENRLLTTQETETFNLIAQELYNKTGVGLAAALYQDIGEEDPREFALKTAESFGIGKKGVDEGILIFVAMNQKRRSVEVGYGAEPYLPDVLVEKIQQQTLVPAFRQRKYGEG
ncbi:MAG TPA: TPM domain-containing protein, partial [Fibrobacteraceae bacterium]|nr:TPM domain-containing protein [Fibrobacteraceae bacterium]